HKWGGAIRARGDGRRRAGGRCPIPRLRRVLPHKWGRAIPPMNGEERGEEDFEQGVMVDVGPGAGALVIYAADELRGQEIEISPLGHDASRTHTDVLRRKTSAGYVNAAVFGSLAE